jgi:hypothetical protein
MSIRQFVRRASRADLVERLRLDAEGPEIHVDYYRQDAADARLEILRLRRLVNTLSGGGEIVPLRKPQP